MEELDLFLSVLRFSAPLILVALGGYLSEKSGVVNIALEGFILFGAFFAASGAWYFENPWIGLAIGGIAGGVVGLLYAGLTVGLKSDQIVAGTGINMLPGEGFRFLERFFLIPQPALRPWS